MEEILWVKRGHLGPIRQFPEGGLRIYPFTLFIGKQGTGKSLVSQLIYFFRNLPFLVQTYRAQLGPDAGPEVIVRQALDDLRSARRAFAVFAAPSASLTYISPRYPRGLGIGLDKRNRRVYPQKSLQEEIKRLERGRGVGRLGDALYIPAERVLYSHARSPEVWWILPLPYFTLGRFAAVLEEAGSVFKDWPNGQPDTEEGRWVRERGKQALAGEVHRVRGLLEMGFWWRRAAGHRYGLFGPEGQLASGAPGGGAVLLAPGPGDTGGLRDPRGGARNSPAP